MQYSGNRVHKLRHGNTGSIDSYWYECWGYGVVIRLCALRVSTSVPFIIIVTLTLSLQKDNFVRTYMYYQLTTKKCTRNDSFILSPELVCTHYHYYSDGKEPSHKIVILANFFTLSLDN